MRKILFVVAFALAHTAVTVWAVMSALGAAVGGFDTGTSANPQVVWFYSTVANILLFPMSTVDPQIAPGLWGWLLFFGNGLMWGSVLVAVWSSASWMRRRHAGGMSR